MQQQQTFAIVICLLFATHFRHSLTFVAADNSKVRNGGSIHVPSVQINVREVESNKHLGTLGIENGQKLAKLLRVDKTLALKFNFSIVDQHNGQLVADAHQVFLRFWHSKANDNEAFFMAKGDKKQKGHYVLEMNMQRDLHRFHDRPGRYHCELIIADQRFREGFQWHLADAFVDIPKKPEPERKSYQIRDRTPKYGLQPELHYTFLPRETCNPDHLLLAYVFTLLCAIPMVFFLKILFLTFGTSMGTILLARIHLLFLVFLTAIFATYATSWFLGWTIAFTFKVLIFFAINCFIFGHNSLKMIAKQRMETEQQEEKEGDEEEEGQQQQQTERDMSENEGEENTNDGNLSAQEANEEKEE